jgi:hypothetical protein
MHCRTSNKDISFDVCYYVSMPGKSKDDSNKTQQQEIADLKEQYLRFFGEFPVQKAAADFIGRSPATIQHWQNNDPNFSASVFRAKAEWAKKASRRIRPDNLLANLYDETKPPKQEIDTKVTTIEGQSAEDLELPPIGTGGVGRERGTVCYTGQDVRRVLTKERPRARHPSMHHRADLGPVC